MSKPKLISKDDAEKLKAEIAKIDDHYLINVIINLLSARNTLSFTSNNVQEVIIQSLGIEIIRSKDDDSAMNDYIVLSTSEEKKRLVFLTRNFIERLATASFVKLLPKISKHNRYAFQAQPQRNDVTAILEKIKERKDSDVFKKNIGAYHRRLVRKSDIDKITNCFSNVDHHQLFPILLAKQANGNRILIAEIISDYLNKFLYEKKNARDRVPDGKIATYNLSDIKCAKAKKADYEYIGKICAPFYKGIYYFLSLLEKHTIAKQEIDKSYTLAENAKEKFAAVSERCIKNKVLGQSNKRKASPPKEREAKRARKEVQPSPSATVPSSPLPISSLSSNQCSFFQERIPPYSEGFVDIRRPPTLRELVPAMFGLVTKIALTKTKKLSGIGQYELTHDVSLRDEKDKKPMPPRSSSPRFFQEEPEFPCRPSSPPLRREASSHPSGFGQAQLLSSLHRQFADMSCLFASQVGLPRGIQASAEEEESEFMP